MASAAPQSRATHRPVVPGFHLVTLSLLLLNLVWSIHRLLRNPEADQIGFTAVAVILLLLYRYIRLFPLKVQDRALIVNWRPDHMRA